MKPRIPKWLAITLIVAAVVLIIGGLTTLIVLPSTRLVGLIVTGVIVLVLGIVAATVGPQLYRWYKFQKYFKQHESSLHMLPSLMQTGRTQEALMRFEGVMQHAPENAYMFYMRAFFLRAAGKMPEALSAANKALKLAPKDPFLPMMLQEVGGQMGQPRTVTEFTEQLEELCESLGHRVDQMRQRRDKAVAKRKKKSR